MQFFFYTGVIIFLIINIRILSSDFQEKRIPNKYLLHLIYLFPFFLVFSILNWNHTHIYIWVLQIPLAFLVTFWLYHYWIWSAWDSKYLLVLFLFLLGGNILTFIWNIALLTIFYLICFFLYFYLIKVPFNWEYRKSLISNIKNDIFEKILTSLKTIDGKVYISTTIKKILKFLLLFLTIFVSIRLIRMYIFENYFWSENAWFLQIIKTIADEYWIYIIFWMILWLFWIIYLFKTLYTWFRKWNLYIVNNYIRKENKVDIEYIDFFYAILSFFILSSYIIYEFFIEPDLIEKRLYRIFTFYLIFYFIIVLLRYTYHITFQIWEHSYSRIQDLKTWEIIDKTYLIKLFSSQDIEWIQEKIEFLQNIKNPINQETRDTILRFFKDLNTHHIEQKTINYSEITHIKTLNTFAFWGYIFWGFLITYILDFKIFEFLLWKFIEWIKFFIL